MASVCSIRYVFSQEPPVRCWGLKPNFCLTIISEINYHGSMSSAQKKESAFDKKPDKDKVGSVQDKVTSDKEAAKPDSVKPDIAEAKSMRKQPLLLFISLGAALVVALVVGIYYFLQYQKSQELLKNPVLENQMETQNLIDKVGKLIELPKDEEPTVATVSDVKKLKSQAFFANAQNGDKVLIYQKAKKAVLYRPSTNKIIEFGPINLGSSEQNSASPSAVVSQVPVDQEIKLVLRNGTKTVGLASTVEKDIKRKASNIIVVTKDNASKQDYTKTLVIDLKGNNSAGVAQVAELVGGEVGKLPTGEVKPADADILVILGKP